MISLLEFLNENYVNENVQVEFVFSDNSKDLFKQAKNIVRQFNLDKSEDSVEFEYKGKLGEMTISKEYIGVTYNGESSEFSVGDDVDYVYDELGIKMGSSCIIRPIEGKSETNKVIKDLTYKDKIFVLFKTKKDLNNPEKYIKELIVDAGSYTDEAKWGKTVGIFTKNLNITANSMYMPKEKFDQLVYDYEHSTIAEFWGCIVCTGSKKDLIDYVKKNKSSFFVS